ncbi:hypothetical protein DFH09DRAFT_1336397 [Mycena vulgaris]|nr:hypothetical protein DFH09DRAFT_1336397 [Mycena vulgaris]
MRKRCNGRVNGKGRDKAMEVKGEGELDRKGKGKAGMELVPREVAMDVDVAPTGNGKVSAQTDEATQVERLAREYGPPPRAARPPSQPPPPASASALSADTSLSTSFARLSLVSPRPGAGGPRPVWVAMGTGEGVGVDVLVRRAVDVPEEHVSAVHPVPWAVSAPSSPSAPTSDAAAQHPRAPAPPPPMYALAEAARNAYLRQLRVVLLPVFRNVVRRLVGLPSVSHRNGKTENTHHSDRLEAVRRQMRNRHGDVRNRAQKSRPVEHTLDRDPRLAHCRCTICEPAMAVAQAAQGGHPASHAPPPTTTPHAKAEGVHEASLVLHIPTEEAGRGADSVVLLVSADEGFYAHTDDDGKLLVERDGGGEDEPLSRRSVYFRQLDVQDGPGAEEREMAMIAEMRARGGLVRSYAPGPGVWVAGRKRSEDELEAETDAGGRGDAARGGTPPKRARTGEHDYTPTIRLIKRRSEELDAVDVDSDAATAKRARHDAAESPPDTNTPGTFGSGEESPLDRVRALVVEDVKA